MIVTDRSALPGYWYPAPAVIDPASAPPSDAAGASPVDDGRAAAGVQTPASPDEVRASAVAVLHAVRRFRRSDSQMRTRTASELAVNTTDLSALRHLVASSRVGEHVSPTELSVHLGISSAATTKLLNRLALLGHIRRKPHPTDRRGQLIIATDLAHTAIQRALGHSHKRMMDVVTALSIEDQRTVIHFLDALGEAVMEEHPRGQDSESAGR
jgi:DNA-binding MarR family transcriptional regulator